MKEKYVIKKNNVHVVLLIRLLIIILILSLSRFALYFFNPGLFSSFSSIEILQAYIVGFRFDLFVLSAFGLVLILGNGLPFPFRKNKNYQGFLNIVSLSAFFLAMVLNFIDSVFYRFTLKRMSYEIIAFLESDGGFIHLIPSFLVDFWFVVLAIILFSLLLLKLFYSVQLIESKEKWSIQFLVKNVIYFIFYCAFIVLGIRGGTQLIPITIVDASKSVNPQLTPLVLNTPFTILKSYGQKGLNELNYYSEERAIEIFDPIKSYVPFNDVDEKQKNVVLLILESFSSEHIGSLSGKRSFTPFLDSLFEQGLVFKGIANGKRSIEGIPTILSSLPTYTTESFLNGPYAMNQIEGLAKTLSKEGYETAFFHGGRNGTMNFDAYAKSAGFESYFGMDEYPNKEDYDGHWGIWDEEFLIFTENKLNNFKEPFLATVFTLSSHHPYKVPKKYLGKYPNGKHAIQQSIAYTDDALKSFFEAAKKEEWFSNTLFVITADHTSEGVSPMYRNSLGQLSIPIAFYSPNDSLIKTFADRSPVQQADIFPSIVHYLGIENQIISFGNSVFDEQSEAFAIAYYGNFQVLDSSYFLQFSGEEPIALYSYKKDSLLSVNLIDSVDYSHLLELQRAVNQQYNNRMIQNKLRAD